MDNQKVCECGCGLPTTVSKRTDKRHGLIKGQPNKFRHGHQSRLTQPTLVGILGNTRESATGCLEWQGGTKKGYGQLMVAGRNWITHRLVYELMQGGIPEGLVIRHMCDNPKCVNPRHLICGTHAENTHDMLERGRTSAGEKRWNARLTEALVVDILISKETGSHLARLYGVSASTVNDVRTGKTWKHIPRAGATV